LAARKRNGFATAFFAPAGREEKTTFGCRSRPARSTVVEPRSRRPAARDQEETMQYLLLIYDDEKKIQSMSKAESDQFMADYFAYTEGIKKSGHFRAGEALEGIRTATTVRVRDGKTLSTDGPFAETREQLGGFYMVEAANLDEAIALGARIPSARTGSIEVRPIMVFDK
jgi:hypothetical protein